MGTGPFGAVASVYAFLRTAAAVNHIGCKILKIPMTPYFDDFTVMTQGSLTGGTKLAVGRSSLRWGEEAHLWVASSGFSGERNHQTARL